MSAHFTYRKKAGGSSYFADDGLVDAANVAMLLQKPLLLTGKPGTGKTMFAKSLADQLGGVPLERFNTRSTSNASDLFYTYDALRRFHDRQMTGAGGGQARTASNSALPYLLLGPLGRAIVRSMPREERRAVFNEEKLALPGTHPEFDELMREQQQMSVVLVDEVDKAPRDFPNDILNVIEDFEFTIPELCVEQVGAALRAHSAHQPVLVFTSNSEKNLPDAFLRRCVYYDIPLPERDRLEEIVLANLKDLKGFGDFTSEALAFFVEAQKDGGFRKELSTAEMLDWLKAALGMARRSKAAPSLSTHGAAALPALVKADDPKRVANYFNAWLEKRSKATNRFQTGS